MTLWQRSKSVLGFACEVKFGGRTGQQYMRKLLDGRKCLTVWLNWWLQDWMLVQVNHTNNRWHGRFHDLAVHKSFRKTLSSPSPLFPSLSFLLFLCFWVSLCRWGNKVWRKRKSTEMNEGGVFTRRRHGSNPILPIWPWPLMETRNGETDICWMAKKTRGYFKCTKLSIGFRQWITGALW